MKSTWLLPLLFGFGCRAAPLPISDNPVAVRETVASCESPQRTWSDCAVACVRKVNLDHEYDPAIDLCRRQHPDNVKGVVACLNDKVPDYTAAFRACTKDDGCDKIRENHPGCFGPEAVNLPSS